MKSLLALLVFLAALGVLLIVGGIQSLIAYWRVTHPPRADDAAQEWQNPPIAKSEHEQGGNWE